MSGVRGRSVSAVVALAAVALVSAVGCSNDDNGDRPSQACLSFTGSATPAPSSVTAAEDTATACGEVIVEFAITEVADLWGAGADLAFDPTRVEFDSLSTSGSVLAADGTVLFSYAEEKAPGVVTVGVTRTPADNVPIDVSGTQRLFRVTFSKLSDSGTSALDVREAKVLDGSTPPVAIPGVTWSGGTFRIQ